MCFERRAPDTSSKLLIYSSELERAAHAYAGHAYAGVMATPVTNIMRNSATIGQRRVIRHNTNTKRNFKHYRSRSNSSVVTFCDEESSQPTGCQGAKLVVDTLYTNRVAAAPKSKSTLIGESFQTTTFPWHACQPQPTPSMLPSMYNTSPLETDVEVDGDCFALCKMFCRSLLYNTIHRAHHC